MNLGGQERYQPIWVAIDTDGKIMGQVPRKTLMRELHAYVERLEAGQETRWPPTPTFHGKPCRFEIDRKSVV